ncbi:MAG: tetratricopeptide repeat protein [Candidatus Riflebacteria bacterium]|nr:tetratricopeptide repeat protein [Candidatus Riflebacteria bacterium]
MAANRFWHRIDLATLAVAVWAAVVLLGIFWWRPLAWSARALPGYLAGELDRPEELALADEAEELLAEVEGPPPARVRALLERSLSIDPLSRARFLLGEYHFRAGDPARAAACYQEFLAVDPNEVTPYLRLAAILEAQGRPTEAEAVLRRGIAWFARAREDWRPWPDPSAPAAAKVKAVQVGRGLAVSHDLLTNELARLLARRPSATPAR